MEGTREGEIAGETWRLLLPRSQECRSCRTEVVEERRSAMSQSRDEERRGNAKNERAQKTRRIDEGRDERERTAPYLRNFKLNCDVFKLTFLPARPHALSIFSLSLSFYLLSPCSFFLALPPAFQLEARARPKVETCDITTRFFRSSFTPARSLSHTHTLSIYLSIYLSIHLLFLGYPTLSPLSSLSSRQSRARKRA